MSGPTQPVSIVHQEPIPVLSKPDSLDSVEPISELRSHAVRGVGALVMSRTACQGILVFSSVILARLLTPKDFGLVAMVTVFSGILLEFGSLRLSDATVQKRNLQQHQISALFWINIIAGCIVAGILMLCAPLIAWFYAEPRLKLIVIAIASTFVLSGLSAQHLALLQRKMKFRSMAILDIAATAFSVVVAVGTAWWGFGYWALVFRRIAYQLASAVGTWSISGWRPGVPIVDEGVRSMLKFGANSLGSYTLTYFCRNMDNLLLGWRVGAGQLGFYDRAYQIFVMPVYQLMNPLTTVAVSTLSRIADDRERYLRYFTKSLTLMAFFAVPVSACVTLAGRDIVIVVLGEKWSLTGRILQAFGPGIVAMLISAKLPWLHISIGRPDRLLRWNIFRFIVTGALLIAGLPYGAMGIAVASAISFYVLAGPGLIYAGKPIGLKLGTCCVEILKYFLAGILSGLIAWALFYSKNSHLFYVGDVGSVIRIIASGCAVLILYVAFTMLLVPDMRIHRDALGLVRNMIPIKFRSSPKTSE